MLRLQSALLRLPASGPERQAIEAGEIDAIVDRQHGNVILLPAAQRAALERNARFRSLLALCSDWHWQHDEHHRFVAAQNSAGDRSGFDLAPLIGKTLWELPFDGLTKAGWRAHRALLKGRAPFHELELGYRDRAGAARWLSLSGEPIFDEQEQFKGYHGIARDVTEQKHASAAGRKSKRLDRAPFDALAVQICVLDAAGTVVMANKAWRAGAPAATGIGAHIPEGASYLAVCDNAADNERADGVAIAAGIRRVTGGESSLFRHEYDCDSSAGRCRQVVTVIGFRENGAARAVVSRVSSGARNVAAQPLARDCPVADAAYAAGTKPAAGVRNSLLDSLPATEYQRLLAGLEPVTLTCGEVLFAPGERIEHVFFPVDCLVSLLATVEGRAAMETGLVGREGMVGISVALGVDVSSVRALVQGTGTALRMNAAHFHTALQQCPALQRELYGYMCVMLAQARQTVVCNRFHPIEARLARWLLMTSDRLLSEQFVRTQAFLGDMLGVLRATVNRAAGALQERGLITYTRGKIRILDRKGLEAACCRCYTRIEGFPKAVGIRARVVPG